MTAQPLLTTLLPLVADLSRDLPEGERYRRLLQAMRALLPCDAAALLRLDGEWLVPLAVDGLSADTLGRRFKVSEHPRFEILLSSPGPTRFDSDSELPDPYDGLVAGLPGHLEVHDCMGLPAVYRRPALGPADPGRRSIPSGLNGSNWTPCKPSPALPQPPSTWLNASSAWHCGPKTSTSAPRSIARPAASSTRK